jgi:hypothetical protein
MTHGELGACGDVLGVQPLLADRTVPVSFDRAERH